MAQAIGSVDQDPPGGDISLIDAVLDEDVERTPLMAEAEASHDGRRMGDIYARLVEIDADRDALARRRDPGRAWASVNQADLARPMGRVLRRLAHARGPGRQACSPSPTCCCSTSPPTTSTWKAQLWLKEALAAPEVPAHEADRHQPRPRAAPTTSVRPHPAPRGGGKLELYTGGYDDFERCGWPLAKAAAAGGDPGQDRGPARPPAVVRRPLPRQGVQGNVQAQSRLKMIARLPPVAALARQEHVKHLHHPLARPAAGPRLSSGWKGAAVGYGEGPPIRRSSTCASISTTGSASSASTAPASRRSSGCCRTA